VKGFYIVLMTTVDGSGCCGLAGVRPYGISTDSVVQHTANVPHLLPLRCEARAPDALTHVRQCTCSAGRRLLLPRHSVVRHRHQCGCTHTRNQSTAFPTPEHRAALRARSGFPTSITFLLRYPETLADLRGRWPLYGTVYSARVADCLNTHTDGRAVVI
jgi:hypothetical protein